MSSQEPDQTSVRRDTKTDEKLNDDDVVVFKTTFNSGVCDFVLHKRVDCHTYQVINPLELLGTSMAVRVLKKCYLVAPETATQAKLSRLLVQCLEYRNNNRHLIVEPWDVDDLRGDHLFENNRTELARDCAEEQANRFRLIMAGSVQPEIPARDQYWGTFSRLPIVADMFDDPALGSLAIKLLARFEGVGVGDVEVEIRRLRSMVKQAWNNDFESFELRVAKKQRRPLFNKLMSVAVRQASSMTRQIAYAFVLKGLNQPERDEFQLSEREKRLFAMRYGSYSPLGNINVGFLFGDGELHTELINELARCLVRNGLDAEYEQAEENLYRHIQSLSELRDHRREIRAEQRQTTRLIKRQKSPGPAVQPEGQEDTSSPQPDERLMTEEQLAELEYVVAELKPRDRERVQAILSAGGDKRAAAKLLNIEAKVFMRRYRQTTQKNVNKSLAMHRRREESEE